MARKKPEGWRGESYRHSLARRGIPTVQKRPLLGRELVNVLEDMSREMEEESQRRRGAASRHRRAWTNAYMAFPED